MVRHLGLADAVSAVHGLHLHGRVPPRLEQEHVAGLLQVKALAARLEAHQNHLWKPVKEEDTHRSQPKSRTMAGHGEGSGRAR